MPTQTGHATVSADGSDFVSLAPLHATEPFNPAALAALAAGMANGHDDLTDGPDPEENRFMPAGYTYFGQFVDHDLTLDTATGLKPGDSTVPTNLRTPRLDLDCVYGRGPDDQPYLYMQEDLLFNPVPGLSSDQGYQLYAGASLVPGGLHDTDFLHPGQGIDKAHDLLRASNGRAIIGDKRNDENSIVNQVQQLVIAFHNRVVETLAERNPGLLANRKDLFEAARAQVRWAYQSIVLRDFLKRIIQAHDVDSFHQAFLADPEHVFRLYPRGAGGARRTRLPREFSVAAYRFGHSAVRLGYRLNARTAFSIFPNMDLTAVNAPIPASAGAASLVGFEPLPASHVIDDWGRFFPAHAPLPGAPLQANTGPASNVPDPATLPPPPPVPVRLQFAYKLDPSLVEPLINLPPAISGRDDLPAPQRPANPFLGPSLALLNLLRGNRYRIGTAQELLAHAASRGLTIPALEARYLAVRVITTNGAQGKTYSFVPINQLPVPPALPGTAIPTVPAGTTVGDLQDLQTHTPLWFYVLAEAQKPVIDFWLQVRHGNPADRATDLTEADLKGVADDAGNVPLADLRASGTQLTGLGARIILEVFYGILRDDPTSLLAPGQNVGTLIWGGSSDQATMADLIRFTAQPGKQFTG